MVLTIRRVIWITLARFGIGFLPENLRWGRLNAFIYR